ncbi:hypothetical protein [Nonomuraea typhae]|uniref:CHAT domain-containing protein n=1 Tax=Nonomuraea typhae TaxID=2603600 RepID=A0ABW7YR44_9ACTN
METGRKNAERRKAAAAELRAQMLTMMTGRPRGLADLHRRAEAELGEADPVTLLIACKSETQSSRTRPVAESVPVWARLVRSADAVLDLDDPARLEIISRYGRWLGRRGEPADLDQAVRHQRGELHRRELGLGAHAYWTGVARLDLAAALAERARLGHLDLGVQDSVAGDLVEAIELSEAEVEHRGRVWGHDDLRTWEARGVLGKALLSRTGTSADRVVRMTAAFIAGRQVRREPRLLQARLLRSQALLAAGRQAEAEVEARLAGELHRTGHEAWPGGVDPGLAALTLARVLAETDAVDAVAAARRALRARLAWFPKNSVYCAEAQAVLTSRG